MQHACTENSNKIFCSVYSINITRIVTGLAQKVKKIVTNSTRYSFHSQIVYKEAILRMSSISVPSNNGNVSLCSRQFYD